METIRRDLRLVSQRAREIGIRMALASSEFDVLRLITSEEMRLVGLGVLTGLAAAVALARALQSLLYGITSYDPATLLAVPGLIGLVALLACLVPARRASRIDPLVALRQE